MHFYTHIRAKLFSSLFTFLILCWFLDFNSRLIMPTWSWPSIALMCYMWNGAKIWRLIMFLLVVVLFVLFSLRYGTVLTNCFRVNGLNVFPLLRFRRLGKKRLLGTNTRRRKKSEKNKGFNRQLPCWRSKTKSIWSPHGSKLSLLIIFNSCMILYKFRLIVGEKRLFFFLSSMRITMPFILLCPRY